MDKRKLEALAKLVEGPRDKRPLKAEFDMSEVCTESYCGTAACLMGLAAIRWKKIIAKYPDSYSIDFKVAKLLGIVGIQRHNLFIPAGWFNAAPYAETLWLRKAAAKTIRKLIKTGSVDPNWLNIAVAQNT
jgi:hypothetical protein